MSDVWWRAGGSAWLDAVLYDTTQAEPDVLLAGAGDVRGDDVRSGDPDRG